VSDLLGPIRRGPVFATAACLRVHVLQQRGEPGVLRLILLVITAVPTAIPGEAPREKMTKYLDSHADRKLVAEVAQAKAEARE
jgi:hypothetical protein